MNYQFLMIVTDEIYKVVLLQEYLKTIYASKAKYPVPIYAGPTLKRIM